jgi:hypothetical protein
VITPVGAEGIELRWPDRPRTQGKGPTPTLQRSCHRRDARTVTGVHIR